ncbi:MAG: hypothetical protein ACTSXY_16405 [Promethearchaeota archaeon]
MKNLVKIVFVSFLLIGCITPRYVPFEHQKKIMEQRQCLEDENCCISKSIEYCKLLKLHGIRSNIVVGMFKGNIDPPHAWVEVIRKVNGKLYMVDPTWSTSRDGLEVDKYPNRKVLVKFKENVTYEEVKKYEGIIKIYHENIPIIVRKNFFHLS